MRLTPAPFALAFLFAFAPVCRGDVMSAGNLELSRAVDDGAGGPVFTAGTAFSLGYSLGQPGGAGFMTAGVYALSGGFYGGPGSGGVGGFGLGEIGLGVANCPSASLRRVGDVLLGLPSAQAVCAEFSHMMLPDTLSAALSLSRVRARDGTTLDLSETVSPAYNQGTHVLEVSPAPNWASNTLYRMVVSTLAMDQDGVPILSSTSFRFLTLSDPAEANTYVAFTDTGTRLRLPVGSLPGPGYVDINESPLTSPSRTSASIIETATAKFKRDRGAFAQVHGIHEVNFYDAAGAGGSLAFGSGGAQLTLTALDADGDGIIDGSSPPARLKSTAIYYLDEMSALWVKVPGSSAGPGGAVTAAVPHLSVFALLSTADESVSQAYAYPVPFRPNGPSAGTGPGQSGTESAGITFVNLPSRATIEVYNVLGERVWRGEETQGTGRLVWNVRTAAGRAAASGVYIYLVKSSSGEIKSDKLAIIR